MNEKKYDLPNGKTAVFCYDDNGVGRVTLEAMDALMEMMRCQWIPCSERLPENNCQCIVTAKVKHVDGYPDYEVDTADYTDGIFATANDCWWDIESIIAWMPLPEPYRADMKGEQEGGGGDEND